jgi:hypothetical protein
MTKPEAKFTVSGRVKKFFGSLFDKLDKKMEAKAKSSSSCCKPNERNNKSCCS